MIYYSYAFACGFALGTIVGAFQYGVRAITKALQEARDE
jgi:hypothetical protein